jgi:hypothetical protein
MNARKLLDAVTHRAPFPSMFDLEGLIDYQQIKIQDEYQETPENELEAFCQRLSHQAGISPEKVDSLIFKSADYLHYNQKLDPDVLKWIKFLSRQPGKGL